MENSLNKNTDCEKAFIKLRQQKFAYTGAVAQERQLLLETNLAICFAVLARKFMLGVKLQDFTTDELKELLNVVYKLAYRKAFLATVFCASIPIVGWISLLAIYYINDISYEYRDESCGFYSASVLFLRTYRILAKKHSMSEMASMIERKYKTGLVYG